jgi:hypothetical protein
MVKEAHKSPKKRLNDKAKPIIKKCIKIIRKPIASCKDVALGNVESIVLELMTLAIQYPHKFTHEVFLTL